VTITGASAPPPPGRPSDPSPGGAVRPTTADGPTDPFSTPRPRVTTATDLPAGPAWLVGPDGRTLAVNAALAGLLGTTVDELVGRGPLALVADRWRVLALFDRRRGGELACDVRFRPADGVDRWLTLSATPAATGHGHGQGPGHSGGPATLVLAADVTDRRRHETDLAHAEQRFRRSFEDAPIGKVLIAPDGRLLEVNRALCRLLGHEAPALVGAHLEELLHPEDVDLNAVLVARTLAGEIEGYTVEQRYRHPTKELIWANLDVSVVRGDDGAISYLVALLTDVTARKAAEAESREAVARFQAAFTHAPIGMAVLELDGALREVNPALGRMLGADPAAISGRRLADLAPPDEAEQIDRELARLRDEGATHLHLEHRLMRDLGSEILTLLTVTAVVEDGGPAAYAVLQVEDITERRSAEHDLRRQILLDPLTGLANRVELEDQLQRALDVVADIPFAVMFLDLDRFKVVNDTYGHAVGDRLLVGVGERIQRSMRAGDTVARLGGDEFVIVARGVTDRRSAEAIANKVKAALRTPFDCGAVEVEATASLGVVLATSEYTDGGQLLRDADTAMYRAKEGGRDRHALFDDGIRLEVIERQEIERTLRRAIEDDDLRLLYQPVIDLHTGRVIGTEALLRVHDPDVGELLAPQQFLAVAEDSRLILELGAWVLDQVCSQLASWDAAGLSPMSGWINVSGLELASADFTRQVQEAVTAHGIRPARLRLEISEPALLEASPAAIAQLRILAASGVRVGIDDFGTGSSTLDFLRELPVSFLKIDRSYTRRLDEPGGEALVGAVVSMGRSLGLEVVAEGVESRHQMETLATLGCDTAQGHLFSPPTLAGSIVLTETTSRSGTDPTWP
jgi:diguanylate cyclase (GGDEF)-like protein/PAS domain S-box-containing protein